MIRRVVQLAVVLGMVTACNRDKPPASVTQQPPADSVATDTSMASAPAGTAGTTGAAAPAGGGGGDAGNAGGAGTQPAPSGGAPAGAAAAATDPEIAAARSLWTVQVGSFSDASNATAMQGRLERLGVPVWTATTTVGGQQFTRVRIGVTTNVADVQALAAKIRGEYGWHTWLAMVVDRSAVPAGMLSGTQTYLGS